MATQWLPLLAVKFHFSLKTVLLAHSLSPIILYLIIFLFIRYLSSEKWLSYIYLLAISTSLHDAFFYVNDEMAQATSLLLLLPTVLRSSKLNESIKTVLLILVILLLQTAHLFLMLAAIVILSIYFLEKRERSVFIGILIVLVVLILKAVIFKSGRDGNSIDTLLEQTFSLKNLYASPFIHFFFQAIYKHYSFPILLMLLLYARTSIKKNTIVACILAFLFMYVLLIVYLRNETTNAYMDRYLSVLIFIFWAVLMYFVSDRLFQKSIYPLIVVLTICIAFSQFVLEKSYTERIDFLKTLMKDQPPKQIYLYESMPKIITQLSWSVPYETLIISSLEGTSKTILVKEHFYKIDDLLKNDKLFLGAEWTFGNPITLDEKYFPLKNALYIYQ